MSRRITTLRLILGLLLAAAFVSTGHAALRVPQVPVSGTALATFFASQGQAIQVVGDQQDAQRVTLPADASFAIETFGATANTFGLYNASLVAPPLYQIYPGAASAGWFVTCSFRTAPTRVVVNLFDANGALQGTTTYLGADPSDIGFYVQGTSGLFYSQDERNATGATRILAYSGTGARAGSTWFATETSGEPGGDFADFIVVVDYAITPVPVHATTWGALKQRFR